MKLCEENKAIETIEDPKDENDIDWRTSVWHTEWASHEPLVWSQSLKLKDDQTRFKELNWALKPWEVCARIPVLPWKIDAYCKVLKITGWKLTHIIQAPLSSGRFNAEMVAEMQEKRILGVVSRYVMILK